MLVRSLLNRVCCCPNLDHARLSEPRSLSKSPPSARSASTWPARTHGSVTRRAVASIRSRTCSGVEKPADHRRPARPATCGAALLVPRNSLTVPSTQPPTISIPGAATSTHSPKFDSGTRNHARSAAPTERQVGYAAGYAGSEVPKLPAAQMTMTPFSRARRIASSIEAERTSAPIGLHSSTRAQGRLARP